MRNHVWAMGGVALLATFVSFSTGALNKASATNFSEDFETSTPDALPNASGFLLEWYGDNANRAGTLYRTAQDGALFDDPIGGPGNKSAVLDNNNHGFTQAFPDNDGPTNATMGFTWSSNPNAHNHGSIEFDFYLSPPPTDGFTYIDVRLGQRRDGVNFVSTAPADTFGWFALRADSDGAGGSVPQIVSNSIPGVGAASVAPLVEATNHLRIDIDNGFHTYTLNGAVVNWDVGGNPISKLPALPGSGAKGVSHMTFVGNFEGAPGTPKGLIWIDNLDVNLVPEPMSGLLAGLASLVVVARRRK